MHYTKIYNKEKQKYNRLLKTTKQMKFKNRIDNKIKTRILSLKKNCYFIFTYNYSKHIIVWFIIFYQSLRNVE